MKQKLLVIELWAMGDLVVATPFLRVAAEKFDVALLAKPMARELQTRLWPGIEVIPFDFPWTAFRRKYDPTRWPWRELAGLVADLRLRRFDIVASGRWDPRDHFLSRLSAAPRRVGFPRLGSGLFLTESLSPPPEESHRYENWRVVGRQLGMELPARERAIPVVPRGGSVVIHSGAAQAARVWPLERFKFLAEKLRRDGYVAVLICDPGQREWWTNQGEEVRTPGTIGEFLQILDGAGLFVGNDSGPGHLAGVLGIPTFTLFGNQYAGRFAPLSPQAEWIEGAECEFKPCYDECPFAQPECLWAIRENEAWLRLKAFAAKHLTPLATSA